MANVIKKGMDSKAMKKVMAQKAMAQMDNDGDEGQAPMKQPLIKPSRKGLLHKKLGVPQGKKLPKGMVQKATHSKSKAIRKEANFARNFSK